MSLVIIMVEKATNEILTMQSESNNIWDAYVIGKNAIDKNGQGSYEIVGIINSKVKNLLKLKE